MKLSIVKGTTSKIIHVKIEDSSSSSGGGLTGLAYNTSSLTCYYKREGASSATAVTLADATLGTFTSGGFKEVSSANMPGIYELHLPDAAIASGASSVVITMKGATSMVQLDLEIELTAVNNQSATAFITGLNSLAPPTNWNLTSIDGSGKVLLQATQTGVTIPTVTDVTNLHASAATVTNQTTILDRLGAWTGSGINTILGAFKSLLSKTASAPSDIGGTFDPTTDSTEALRDRGDAAWVTGGGGSAPTVEAIRAEMDSNSTQLAKLGAPAGASISADIAAVKLKTDNLPASPAAVGSAMTLAPAERAELRGYSLSGTTLTYPDGTTATVVVDADGRITSITPD